MTQTKAPPLMLQNASTVVRVHDSRHEPFSAHPASHPVSGHNDVVTVMSRL